MFDQRYATRGIAMLESLHETMSRPFNVTVLAMDRVVPGMLAKIGRPEWKVVEVANLGDKQFAELEKTRPHREFCWTAAPVLAHRMTEAAREGDLVVYVDADLFFYGDPVQLTDELGVDGSILIHEHRYSPDRVQYEATSGRFNVGFVAFRVGDEARRCASRWRQQVFEKCELDPDNGYCGDQGYLNEWPALYPGLRIISNIGGGAAPWNLTAYRVTGEPERPSVNGVPVVFFHYHAFRSLYVEHLGFVAARPAYGYRFSSLANRLLFSLYASRLRTLTAAAHAAGYDLHADERIGARQAARGWLANEIILAY